MFPRLRLVLTLAVILLFGWLALGPVHHALRSALDDVRTLRTPVREPVALPVGSRLPSLAAATGWVNGGPVTPDSLGARMTVVVVFRDTRPASLEWLPELEELYEGFAGSGLRVVGVHAPEFAFAADTAVTARFARRLGLRFPVALDATRALERALGGADASGCPRKVIVDSAGRVVANGTEAGVYDVRGAISEYLPGVPIDAGRPYGADVVGPGPAGSRPRFLTLGAGRVERGPLADAPAGFEHTYTAQFRYQEQGEPEVAYPVGRWRSDADGVTATRGGAAQFLSIRYDAPRSGPARMGVVMSPPPGGPVRVWVLRDEKWLPREALGEDARLDERGASYVELSEARFYRVARGGGVYKLSPEVPGVGFLAISLEPHTPRH